MLKKKNKQIKTSTNKSNLDQVLWFIENYFEAFTIDLNYKNGKFNLGIKR